MRETICCELMDMITSWHATAHRADVCRAAQRTVGSNRLFALMGVLKALTSVTGSGSLMGIFHTLNAEPARGRRKPSE